MPLKCLVCGSNKIIPNVRIVDRADFSLDGGSLSVSGKDMMSRYNLEVELASDPNALVFKGWKYGQLVAHICGECGHADIGVTNPRQLYQHYLKSKKNVGSRK